jgi:hypothetical protein
MGEGGNKGSAAPDPRTFNRFRPPEASPAWLPRPGASWRQLSAVITRPFGLKFLFLRTAALVPAYPTGSSSIMPAAVLEIGMW